MKKIAIYGKGGIGKSTTVSNISAALSKKGYTVMQIGCDPKSDSTRIHARGKIIPTVLDLIKSKGKELTLDDAVYVSENGVLCVEAGGPTPGVGCAGRGIIAAFEKLDELNAFEIYKPDVVLYDVLGDVVCGGFAMPIRKDYAEKVFVVTSGEMMALYAATNIHTAVSGFKSKGYAEFGGLILNSRNVENEIEKVNEVAKEIDSIVLHIIPRDPLVQQSEDLNKTVIELFPESKLYDNYMDLASKIIGEGV